MMSNEDIVPANKVSFITEKHELTTLSTKVRKLNSAALRVLEDALVDPDVKVRMEAAKALLKMDIDISKIINDDAMNRILAELKMNGEIKNVSNNNSRPLVDFSSIQQV
jgi:HEAT repeat protein